jgi:hypothetical protein
MNNADAANLAISPARGVHPLGMNHLALTSLLPAEFDDLLTDFAPR